MVAKRIRVFGKVQGVFYRATAKSKAEDLNLTGWVRNETDGTVMMEVEGSEEQIDAMITWCKEGPPYSRVDDVLHEVVSPQGRKDFEIIH